MRALFLDVSAGAAGDMLSAALLELCQDRDAMLARLNAAKIPGVTISAQRVEKHGVVGKHLTVLFRGEEEEQGVPDAHPHHHAHVHRGMFEIREIVAGLDVPETVRRDVLAVYQEIAEAEAEVHGTTMEHIHFHELGSMDAIADITAACLILHELRPEHITASPVCTGFGEILCAHGRLSVPAPATARILRSVPSFAGDMEGELCTPTGAALIKHFAQTYSRQPAMTAERIGYGMGKKDFPKLSAVRAVLGSVEETIVELSCNVDDMSPEAVGFAIEELLRLGAPDAYYTPIGMKKNRPGVILTCLCREDQRDEMVRALFRHTTTLGIRETLCRRYVLRRAERMVETPYGPVRVKRSEGYGVEREKAEFDDLRRIAREADLTLDEARELLYE